MRVCPGGVVFGGGAGWTGARGETAGLGARRARPRASGVKRRALRLGPGRIERVGGATACDSAGTVVRLATGNAGCRSLGEGLRGCGIAARGSGPFEGLSASAKGRSATGVSPSPPSKRMTSQPKTSSVAVRPRRRIQRPRRPVASSRTARSPLGAGDSGIYLPYRLRVPRLKRSVASCCKDSASDSLEAFAASTRRENSLQRICIGGRSWGRPAPDCAVRSSRRGRRGPRGKRGPAAFEVSVVQLVRPAPPARPERTEEGSRRRHRARAARAGDDHRRAVHRRHQTRKHRATGLDEHYPSSSDRRLDCAGLRDLRQRHVVGRASAVGTRLRPRRSA